MGFRFLKVAYELEVLETVLNAVVSEVRAIKP